VRWFLECNMWEVSSATTRACCPHGANNSRDFRPTGAHAVAENIAKRSIRKRFTVAEATCFPLGLSFLDDTVATWEKAWP
jgi:hypothetical protein